LSELVENAATAGHRNVPYAASSPRSCSLRPATIACDATGTGPAQT